MSADLLRRAATKLREMAASVPPGPWESLNDGDRLVAWQPTDAGFDDGFVYVVDEPVSPTAAADYFALMHPPVALALAQAMEQVARVIRYDERAVARVGYGELVEVARAVLREDPS